MQSEWQREGRKKGYKKNNLSVEELKQLGYVVEKKKSNLGTDSYFVDNPNMQDRRFVSYIGYDTEAKAWDYVKDFENNKSDTVPDFPFKNNWQEFVMKRMLRMAAQEGYDGISWATGQQTADRYDLSKQVKSVSYYPDTQTLMAWDKNNSQVIEKVVKPSELENYIGKDAAKKLLESELENDVNGSFHDLVGQELKIGGEWAINLYDKQLVNFMDKYAKKWGAKVGEIKIPTTQKTMADYRPITNRETNTYDIEDRTTGEIIARGFNTQDDQLTFLRSLDSDYKKASVHAVSITDDMRRAVLFEGQQLFQRNKAENPTERFKKRMEAQKIREEEDQTALNLEDNEIPEEPMIDLPVETVKQLIQRKIQDKMNRSEQLVKEAQKLSNVPDKLDFYLQSELYIGRAADQIELFEKMLVSKKHDGILDRMVQAGIHLDDMGEYLYAKHAKERNKAILEKNGRKNGSGLSDAEADAILAKYTEKPEYERFAREIKEKIIKPSLDLRFKSGLMDAEKYEEYKNGYEFYVPLKGTSQNQSNAIQRVIGKGYSVNSKGLWQAQGRKSISNNPLMQAILDHEDVIIRAEKNHVGQSFLSFAERFPNENIYEIRSARFKPEYDEKGEQVGVDKIDKMIKDNEFSVWVKGSQKIITIYDPALLRGLKNLGIEKSIPVLNTVNSYLRNVTTMVNPEFLLTNFERDLQTAMINLGGEQSLKVAKDVLRDLPKAMKGIYSNLKEETGSEWSTHFDDFKAHGAKTGWLNMETLEEKTKSFEKMLNKLEEPHKVAQAAKATLEFISDMNETVENAIRLSAYVNAQKIGMSKQRAAALAKNLTVNFNKKGEWGAIINSLYLFSNAGIQGSAKLISVMKHPKARRIGYGLIASSVLLSMLNKFNDGDDDDYDKMPDWYKDTHWIFVIPGSKNHIKIKQPYGYNIFNVLGNIISDGITGRTDFSNSFGRVLSSLEDAFNPFGSSGSLAQLVAPTALDPFIQLAENKTFTGAPIRKEQFPYQPYKPANEMHFKSVNPYAKEFTAWLNEVTGGRPTTATHLGKSGLVDINPEDIEFVMDFLGGGAGKFVKNTLTTGTTLATDGKFPEIRNIPFVRQAVGKSTEENLFGKMYDMLQESGRSYYSKEERKEFYNTLKDLLKQKTIDAKEYMRYRRQFDKGQGIGETSQRSSQGNSSTHNTRREYHSRTRERR